MARQATAVGPRLRSRDDEGTLVRAATAGGGQAAAALYRRYEERVFNLALRITGNEHDAAEATRAAYLEVLARLAGTADPERVFQRQLFTAACNAGYAAIEKRRRAGGPEGVAAPDGPDGGLEAGEDDPLLDDWRDELRTANARLPARQREVLALRELGPLSYPAIAEIMEIPLESVAQLIAAARIELRDELRGTDLAAEQLPSEECEQALPLIAMRDDEEIEPDSDDAEWLIEHLVGCRDCRSYLDAMQEARLSYSSWEPVAAPGGLFEETIAAAAVLIEPAQGPQPERRAGTPAAVSSPAGEVVGEPASGADHHEDRATEPLPSTRRSSGHVGRRRREIMLAGGWAAALLLGVLAIQTSGVFGTAEGEDKAPETTLEPPRNTEVRAAEPSREPRKRAKPRDKEPERGSTPPVVQQQPVTPAPVVVRTPAAQQPRRAAPRRRPRRQRAERPRAAPPQTAPAPQQQAPGVQEAPAPGGTSPTTPADPAPPQPPPAGCTNPEGQPVPC